MIRLFFCSIAASIFVTLFTLSAQADVFLNTGDSIKKNGEVIYCGQQSQVALQRAVEKTCAGFDYFDGNCVRYNSKEITGRFCAEGKVCKKYDMFGEKCVAYDQTAICGNNSCTKEKVCKKADAWGACTSVDTIVKCN